MGTLYVVGAPAGDPDDLTLRASRILAEVSLVVASEVEAARRLLAHHGIPTPFVVASGEGAVLAALQAGDVALLLVGWSPAPSGPELALVRAAVEHGWPVEPIPGPALPLTALVLSGLPADSFVYLGELPGESAARCALLNSVAGERRTLVALAAPDGLDGILADLPAALGERPLVQMPTGSTAKRCVLVVGGARDEPVPWEQARLLAEIDLLLSQGLRVKKISQSLAAESGWPRREVYRLAVETTRPRANRREADAKST